MWQCHSEYGEHCHFVPGVTGYTYTAKSNTRNRIPGTRCTEKAVSMNATGIPTRGVLPMHTSCTVMSCTSHVGAHPPPKKNIFILVLPGSSSSFSRLVIRLLTYRAQRTGYPGTRHKLYPASQISGLSRYRYLYYRDDARPYHCTAVLRPQLYQDRNSSDITQLTNPHAAGSVSGPEPGREACEDDCLAC
eukprot:2904909-Rhodomonas_salina.1